MSRRKDFDHAAVDYRVAPATGDPMKGTGQWLHKVTAHVAGEQVGFLDWNPVRGTVHMVHVKETHRGSGIAEGMWQHAHLGAEKNGLVAPKHSDVQTPYGNRWANGMTARSGPQKVGRPRPSRKPGPGQQELF